jgi:hypothetical protein
MSDDSYWHSQIEPLEHFCHEFSQTSSQFLLADLQSCLNDLLGAVFSLRQYTALNFFVYPRNQPSGDVRLCLYPDLNVDRDGSGTIEEMDRYETHRDGLDQICKNVREMYDAFRTAVKRRLAV